MTAPRDAVALHHPPEANHLLSHWIRIKHAWRPCATAVAVTLTGLTASVWPAQAAHAAGYSVTITAPAAGASVGSSVPVAASVSGTGIDHLEWSLESLVTSDVVVDDVYTAPYSNTLDSSGLQNGQASLTADLYSTNDPTGSPVATNTITVTIAHACDPETASVTSPAAGATVAGRQVTLSASVQRDDYSSQGFSSTSTGSGWPTPLRSRVIPTSGRTRGTARR